MPELRHIPRIIKYPRNSAQRTLTVADASVEIDGGCRGQAEHREYSLSVLTTAHRVKGSNPRATSMASFPPRRMWILEAAASVSLQGVSSTKPPAKGCCSLRVCGAGYPTHRFCGRDDNRCPPQGCRYYRPPSPHISPVLVCLEDPDELFSWNCRGITFPAAIMRKATGRSILSSVQRLILCRSRSNTWPPLTGRINDLTA